MKTRILLVAFILAVYVAAAPAPLFAQKLKAEDVVARHLASLGSPEARAGVKSRLAQGTVLMQVLVGGSADLGGTIEVASLGHDSVVGMDFGHSAYQRERFVCKDGAVEVSRVNPSRRSDLGNFLYAKSHIVSEGLLGGALSTAWSLLDTEGRTPKLKYDGLKKVDGRQLHALRYTPKKRGNELEIMLYFDDQFHHVKTVYNFIIPAALGAGAAGASTQTPGSISPESGTTAGRDESPEVTAARLQESRFRLEEDFSEFQNVQGLTMPSKWRIRLTSSTSNSRIWEWQSQFTKIENNADVGPGQFTIKQ
jgi:hypothetical protein